MKVTKVACTCATPYFVSVSRKCKNCGGYDEVTPPPSGDKSVLAAGVPEEYLDYGTTFTSHLYRKGGCLIYRTSSGGAPSFKGVPVRRMLVEVPVGWYVRAGCRERNCVEPEHQEISITKDFYDTSRPVLHVTPMRRGVWPKDWDKKKEFMEV